MEYVNFKVFVLLTVFIREYVVVHFKVNRMNAHNMGVVFGPCLFRPKAYGMSDLMNSGKLAKVLVTVF